MAHSIQQQIDRSTCVNRRLITAEVCDFPKYPDCLMLKLLEVLRSDSGGCLSHLEMT